MKLLLTSCGIINESLAKTVKRLVGRRKIKIAFIPTAANASDSTEKGWLIKNYNECERLGSVDIVDISAVDKRVWLPRLRAANVIVMGGGGGKGVLFLMRWILKSGLEKELPNLLKDRVYVGISAGSIIASKRLSASSMYLFGRKAGVAPKGLGYIDFYVRPHLNSAKHLKVRDGIVSKRLDRIDGDLYVIDDDTGILCSDGKVTVVSEGKWKRYTKRR